MKRIEAHIEDGGEITIGPIGSIECVATASDAETCLVMLVRRENESFNALLKRLDKAIGTAAESGDCIDEVNG